MSKFVFLGDSHTWPLVEGARSFDPSLAIKPQPLGSQRYLCEPFFVSGEKSITITHPDVAGFVQALPLPGYEDNVHVVSVGFHTAHFTWIAKNFSHLDTVKDERWAISTATWDAIFEEKQQYQKAFLLALRQIVPHLVVVEAPRLFLDSEYCAGRNLDTIRFIDGRVRETFAAFLDKNRIPLVRVPQEMIDRDGFMSTRYKNGKPGDQHHANAKFGAELMPEILRLAAMPA